MEKFTQQTLVDLANRWEPEASNSPPGFRRATCVVCAREMESMWHLWLEDGGFKKEIHACRECGRDLGLEAPETLIVVAAVDHSFDGNIALIKERHESVVRMDTSGGGHPSSAFIRAFYQYPDYESYLFIQDSLRPTVDDIVLPFSSEGSEVVAWGLFPLSIWDGDYQYQWVREQFPEEINPSHGIFGPIFYATRSAMERSEPWFPRRPRDRLEAQGTERAWAYTFAAAGIEVGSLGTWSNQHMSSGNYPVFVKQFAGRP